MDNGAFTGSNATTDTAPMIDEPPVSRRRSKRKILVWTIGSVSIFCMAMSVLLPNLCRPRETANRIKCASNLLQLGQAIASYARANGGQYPPSLAVLCRQEEISSEMMVCPSSNDERSPAPDTAGVVADVQAAETNAAGHKHRLSYIYVASQLTTTTTSETTIVAYEPLDNHSGEGVSVLFGDGHVDFIDKQSWPKTAAAAGVAVVPSLTNQP